ncbi:hypothetical protein B0H17DRAFT_194330 [Mycena rosella]|uniref:Alpha/beta hydrolase fold-3 domain-containing protein n=1 Tax=Mycena rosella TaxID=1033263 RepID=A0AAD7G686_MYCRO|nr:hypothetical protein B0H17DRAFT_194330 [Mycena rosella]
MANFPTPLDQARLALEFLIAAGVKPANLQITGDSAGGKLVLQLFSQMLHPRSDVPEIHLTQILQSQNSFQKDINSRHAGQPNTWDPTSSKRGSEELVKYGCAGTS